MQLYISEKNFRLINIESTSKAIVFLLLLSLLLLFQIHTASVPANSSAIKLDDPVRGTKNLYLSSPLNLINVHHIRLSVTGKI